MSEHIDKNLDRAVSHTFGSRDGMQLSFADAEPCRHEAHRRSGSLDVYCLRHILQGVDDNLCVVAVRQVVGQDKRLVVVG